MASTKQGGLKVTDLNGVKVYTISGHRSLPAWLAAPKLKSLRKDDEYMRRIELIQDLNFPSASTRIKSTPDGAYILASGIYPPQVKVYEVKELSLKFERHLDAEIVDFQVLGDDYSKLAFLCSDRSVCFHAKYGSHYQMRIPRMGRDLAYDRWSCDLVVAASSPEMYRINLEQGRFLAPLSTRSPGINVVGRSPVHGLIACGCEDGAVEFFDLRQKASISRIDAVGPLEMGDQEVTALRFDEAEGLQLAVGTSSGQVLLYDLRSSSPFQVKDHMYGCPIVDIKWHLGLNTEKTHIISADRRVVRIWDPVNGKTLTNVEPATGEINDICVIKNSGVMLMALDTSQIPSYFIPTLGPAPRWCSYLENLTEELEEGGECTIYDDFKFITREDLEKLNLTNLIGTNLLRAYMHGFFIDHRLYMKAKAMADPFAYEAYRKQRIQEKMDAERAARITIKRKLPKVNKELAARLLAVSDDEEIQNQDGLPSEKEVGPRKKKKHNDLLKDGRFSAMFSDEAFKIDEESNDYKALHPNAPKGRAPLVDEHFDVVDESESDEPSEKDSSRDSSSEDEMPKARSSKRPVTREKGSKNSRQTASVPKLYEVKDETHANAFRNQISLRKAHSMPLEKRISLLEKNGSGRNRAGVVGQHLRAKSGSQELSFMSSRRQEGGGDGKQGKRKKRGVTSLLGLKSDSRPKFKGRGNFKQSSRGRGR